MPPTLHEQPLACNHWQDIVTRLMKELCTTKTKTDGRSTMRLGRVWSGSRLRADFPRFNRGPAVAALRTRGILSFRQGTLYSRATSVLGREASDLDELRRGSAAYSRDGLT